MNNLEKFLDIFNRLADAHDEKLTRGERPSMQEITTLLNAARMYARVAQDAERYAWSEYRELKHKCEVAKKKDGMHFLPAEMRLKELKERSELARGIMADFGDLLMAFLDEWQNAGATHKDLLRLCNADYPGMRKQLEEDRFSILVFEHDLDYKDDTVDAPMTHCMKEWWFRELHTNPIAHEAAHQALENVFPDLMEKALTVQVNEDGIRELYDSDGEYVGTLDSEQ